MINNITQAGGIITALAFIVSIIVQYTKGFIKIPTKIWVLIVSSVVVICSMALGISEGYIVFDVSSVVFSLLGSFLVAYVSMYGFDTVKELWERFKDGGGIDG